MIPIIIMIIIGSNNMERIEDITERISEDSNGLWYCSDGKKFRQKLFAILHERRLLRIENRRN